MARIPILTEYRDVSFSMVEVASVSALSLISLDILSVSSMKTDKEWSLAHFVHFLSCILYKNVPGFQTPKFLDCSLYLTLPIDSNTGDFNFIYHSFQIA